MAQNKFFENHTWSKKVSIQKAVCHKRNFSREWKSGERKKRL